MMSARLFSLFPIVAVLTFVCWPTDAHAYLSADSGSVLLQALLGGAAGLAVFFRMLWHRITRKAAKPQLPSGAADVPSDRA